MISTREEVYSYLEKISREFKVNDLKRFTANSISGSMNISRTLACQYLNELVKEQRAIKVNSRPVYYFHKKNIERCTQTQFDICVFSSREEFVMKCTEHEKRRDFQKLIGFYLSLAGCVESCKAAITYPPYGIPVLMYGANGTGKVYMSHLMYEYGKNEGIIRADAKYLLIDCTEYAEEPEKFAKKMDEIKEKWVANGGVLVLDEVDRLRPVSQELLFSIFFEEKKKLAVRLILATTKPPREALIKSLARRVPMVIQLPTLNERTSDEREELLLSFLKEEGCKMGVDVRISRKAFQSILDYPYENNINGLRASVTSCCANAYMEKTEKGIAIQMYHLPDEIFSGLKLENDALDPEQMLNVNKYNHDSVTETMMQYFQMILEIFHDYQDGKIPFETLLIRSQEQMTRYCDYLIYGQKVMNTRISTYDQLIGQIFETVESTYGISISKKYSYLLARYLDISLREDHFLTPWVNENEKELEQLLHTVGKYLEQEYRIAENISRLLKKNLGIKADYLHQLFLVLGIRDQNQKISNGKTAGIILSHGYATASSIADAANQIIGKKVFDAIDMPLDTNSGEIARLLEKHIEQYIICRNIVLMVDMGSLEQIHQELKNLGNVNLGIINNISTALAVDIGIGISGGIDMESVLKRASKNTICTYQVIRNLKKRMEFCFWKKVE